MNKRIFAFPKMTTKNICTIGLLIAVTFILSYISGYLRIGTISKLSISFVSVFVAAYLYGGLTGGLVAAVADIISFSVNPVGGFLPQLTLIEFLYGFLYGAIFYKTKKRNFRLKVVVCDILQLAINLVLKTAILSLSFRMNFNATFISRIPLCMVQAVIILVVLILIKPFLRRFAKITN